MKITVTSDKAHYDDFKTKFELASKELTVLLENEAYLNKPINFLLKIICQKYGFELRSYVTYDYETNKYSLITKLFDKKTSCNLELSTTMQYYSLTKNCLKSMSDDLTRYWRM